MKIVARGAPRAGERRLNAGDSEWAEAFALLWAPLMAGLGLIVGSFANVCVHRLPRGESVVRPRSRCPKCGRPIAALENVPVLSFLLLGGRCRGCGLPISWRYPAVEALNGALWLGVALVRPPGPRAVADAAFLTALVVLALIDAEHQILPDAITKPGVLAGLLASFLPDALVTPLQAALAALAGYLALAAVALTYRLVRGEEGLGRGDWKMAAMLGAFLGWKPLLLTVFVASLGGTLLGLGLMVWSRLRPVTAGAPVVVEPPEPEGAGAAPQGTRPDGVEQELEEPVDWQADQGLKARLPLGTLLALAALPVYFAGHEVIAWYRGLLLE